VISNRNVKVQPTVIRTAAYQPYIPVELMPFDGRAGAMDAFSLPSMVNGKRVPRTAPILNSESK